MPGEPDSAELRRDDDHHRYYGIHHDDIHHHDHIHHVDVPDLRIRRFVRM